MYRIELSTRIQAPIERCFDLARSIDLHTASTEATHERAVSGVITGLIGMGESVTFRARHFGIWLTHTSVITALEQPHHFRDEMTRGFFRHFTHDHCFEEDDSGTTTMRDILVFRSKFGLLSPIVDALIIRPRLKRLLFTRNEFIRRTAESDDYKIFLSEVPVPPDSQETIAAAREAMYRYRHALRKLGSEGRE